MKDFWNKHKKLMLGVFVVIGIALLAVVSYAYLKFTAIQTDNNKLSTLCLNLKLEEVEGSGINLQETYPISEEQGQRLTPYTFTITNTCKNVTPYQVNLDILTDLTQESSLGLEYIRASLNKEASKLLSSYTTTEKTVEGSTTSKELTRGELSHNESITYELRLWMDERTTADEGANKEFSSKIVVTATTVFPEYKEEILNGTDPVLKEGLIPVTISDDGTVKVAELSEEWYSYANQRWANAVILNEGKKAEDYTDKIIPESDIESYFVWIPKYRYKLWDLGQYETLSSSVQNKVQTIDIIFGDYDTIDKEGECKTPGVSGSTGNCKVGDYMTHPAFQAFGVKGLWVGKFETGYKGATTTAEAQQNVNDVDKVEIKPNVYSWRVIRVAIAHLNSYNYKREYDSHLMKNTEWGAVAYLQHSIYGSRKSVRINNNSAMITGYSAKNEPTTGYTGTNEAGNIYEGTAPNTDGTNTYNYFSNQKDSEGNTIADLASTTANKTGIYDMSGGVHDYVMGVSMAPDNVTLCVGPNSTYTSGFAGKYCNNDGYTTGDASGVAFPTEKYYDKYAYGSHAQFQRGILGDATKEIGPFANATYGSQTKEIGSWYADSASWFVNGLNPWFVRGYLYSCGTEAGMFAFGHYRGATTINFASYHIVLAI